MENNKPLEVLILCSLSMVFSQHHYILITELYGFYNENQFNMSQFLKVVNG